MLNLMDQLRYTYLMILCFLTFVSIYGKDRDLRSSCEVELMVQRGKIYVTPLQRFLRVECPVKHCGESLNVTWCKLSSYTGHCAQINKSDNVEITQNYSKKELVSYLTFKRISSYDEGLYRCNYKHNVISHTINISVSDLYQGLENSTKAAAEPLSFPINQEVSWLPYFYICISIALLVAVFTVLTQLSFHGWKRTLNYKPTNDQKMSTCMIPDLPKKSDPTAPVLQNNFYVLNDIYCPSTAGTLSSPPFLITNGNQPLANEGQASARAVYAVIDHTKSILPVTKQPTATRDPDYATINFS